MRKCFCKHLSESLSKTNNFHIHSQHNVSMMKNIKFARQVIIVRSESHSSILIIVFGSLKTKLDQPVNGCGSLTGAVDGPCSGHLALSQATLAVEALVEGQVNSLPWLWQTWAGSPGCVCHSNNQLF